MPLRFSFSVFTMTSTIAFEDAVACSDFGHPFFSLIALNSRRHASSTFTDRKSLGITIHNAATALFAQGCHRAPPHRGAKPASLIEPTALIGRLVGGVVRSWRSTVIPARCRRINSSNRGC
jgi:hypothetical protein